MTTFLDSPEFDDIRSNQTNWKWIQSELSKTAIQLQTIRRRRAALLLCAFNLGKIEKGDTFNGIPVGDYLAYARQEISYNALNRLRTPSDCIAIAKTGLVLSAQDLYLEKAHHHFKVTDDGRVVETKATLDKVQRAEYARTYDTTGLRPRAERQQLAEAEAKAIRQRNREYAELETVKPKSKPDSDKPWEFDKETGVLTVKRPCTITAAVLRRLVTMNRA